MLSFDLEEKKLYYTVITLRVKYVFVPQLSVIVNSLSLKLWINLVPQLWKYVYLVLLMIFFNLFNVLNAFYDSILIDYIV